jgi:hypothetical protein
MADSLVQRSIRYLVLRALERLNERDALADLAPFRATVANVRAMDGVAATALEATELLEAAIRERERVQERAGRVIDGGQF